MAMLDRNLRGDFDTVLARLHDGVMHGSATATYEGGDDVTMDGFRCAVRMYERFSAFGGNRVAMCVTLVGKDDQLHVTAITAGGSQAMLFKMNTVGEAAFLDTLEAALSSLR